MVARKWRLQRTWHGCCGDHQLLYVDSVSLSRPPFQAPSFPKADTGLVVHAFTSIADDKSDVRNEGYMIGCVNTTGVKRGAELHLSALADGPA